jgi:ribosome-associated protein
LKLSQENESEKIIKKKPTKLDSKKLIKKIILILEDKKCEDIKVLNLENVNSYLSIFIICTVNSLVQARAASRDLEKTLKEYKLGPGNQEKKAHSSDNGWILLDLGEIIVHLMTPEKRKYYDLEKLWGDANPLKL